MSDRCQTRPIEAITYEQYGRAFIERAVTPARVEAAVRVAIAGDIDERIEVGGGLAVATARGSIEQVSIERVDRDHDSLGLLLAFDIVVRVPLSLRVNVVRTRNDFAGHLDVVLRLSVVTLDDLSIRIDVDPVRARNIDVVLDAASVSARLIGRLGRIRSIVAVQVRDIVSERLDDPAVMAQRRIAVPDLIDRAWP